MRRGSIRPRDLNVVGASEVWGGGEEIANDEVDASSEDGIALMRVK